tara:strand:- start:5643 stop:6026 length:384 start_codon:yes stop_codon:yes gene_type:complete
MSSPSDTVFQDMLKTPLLLRQFSGPGYRSDQPFKGFDGVTLTHKEFIIKLEELLALSRRDNTKLKRDNTKLKRDNTELRNMLIEINNRLRATTTQPLNGGRKSRRKRRRRNTKKRKRKTNRKTKAVK